MLLVSTFAVFFLVFVLLFFLFLFLFFFFIFSTVKLLSIIQFLRYNQHFTFIIYVFINILKFFQI